MKTTFTCLVAAISTALCLFSTIATNAQPTLTTAGTGLNGNIGKETVYGVYNTVVSQGSSGASQTWNFGTLTSTSGTSIYWQNCSSPVCDSFPGSTFYSSDLTQYGVYYNTTASATTIYGAGSLGLKVHYTNTDEVMHFPFTYGNQYADSFASNTRYGSSTSLSYQRGTDSVMADAWGTITTPLNTYPNALRIKRVYTTIDSSSATNVNYYRSVSYIWYVPTVTDYVFMVNSSVTTGTTPSSSNSAQWIGKTSGVSGVPKDGGVTIAPNPANNQLRINIQATMNMDANIIITDMVGRTLTVHHETLKTGANNVVINIQELPAGSYLVSIPVGDTRIVKKFQKI